MESKTHKQGMIKGAMILGIGVFVSRFIGLLYRIPIINIIGAEGNGLYSSAFNVYSMILTFTAISMPSALSKLIAERQAVGAYRDAHRVYKVAMIYSVILSSVFALIMWVGSDQISDVLFKDSTRGLLLRALAPTVIIATIMAVIRGYFQGQGNMIPTAVSQIVEQVFNVLFSVLLAYLFVNYSILAGAAGSTLGTGVGALVGLVALVLIYWRNRRGLRKKIKHSQDYPYESTRVIFRQMLVMIIPVFISTSIFSIMNIIDTSMAYRMLPASIEYLKNNQLLSSLPITLEDALTTERIIDSLVGQLSFQFFTLLNVPISLIIQLGGAAIPAIASGMAVGDFKDVRRKIKLIFKTGLLVGAPSAVGLLIFAKPINMLLLSETSGYTLLSSGAIGLIFIALAQLSAGILQGMGKPNISTINAAVACGIKILANLVLLSVPRLHIYGLIHSSTLCYFIYAVLNMIYLKKRLNIKFDWKKILLRPLLSAGIMGILSWGLYSGLMLLFPSEKLWILVTMPAAVLIYFMAGLATRAITKNDLLYMPGGRKIIHFFSRFQEE